jgi:hypothetical protein
MVVQSVKELPLLKTGATQAGHIQEVQPKNLTSDLTAYCACDHDADNASRTPSFCRIQDPLYYNDTHLQHFNGVVRFSRIVCIRLQDYYDFGR